MIPNDRNDQSSSPDVTHSVMHRLGYNRATDPAQARSMRTSRIVVGIAQGALVLAACALGAAWWMGNSRADRSQPAVGDALRGSVVQGAGRLDSILLGMPRVSSSDVLQASETKRAPEAASTVTDGAVHVRSY
ncbi:MAG: hypothetical protein DWH89_02700 [Planctomycetota bacterium]|jgi:hypothetical protein|nr:MAG: hypothetical protein DWH89_02700 [Planctomycetota bacterium]